MQPIAAKLRRGVKRQRAPEQSACILLADEMFFVHSIASTHSVGLCIALTVAEAAETSINDLDAKIAELEAQLQAASGSDGDEEDASSSGSDDDDERCALLVCFEEACCILLFQRLRLMPLVHSLSCSNCMFRLIQQRV